MERDDAVSPIVVLCLIGVVLLAFIGTFIEPSVGRGSPLWSATASLFPLLLAVIAIHYLRNIKRHFARRIFFWGIDYVVIINYLVWSLILLMSGLLFAGFVMDMLGKLS